MSIHKEKEFYTELKKSNKTKNFFKIIVICILLAGAAALIYFLDYGCIFRKIFGVICPSCGLSRAFMCCLKLDFAGAFYYHPMIFSLPVLVLYIIKNGVLFKNSVVNRIVLAAIGAGFVLCYIIRLFLGYL